MFKFITKTTGVIIFVVGNHYLHFYLYCYKELSSALPLLLVRFAILSILISTVGLTIIPNIQSHVTLTSSE